MPLDSDASDEALAARVQRGDREALERLVRRYVRVVHGIAASYLPERVNAEDAVQDTFLRLLRGLRGYDASKPFAPWLYQIARNVARTASSTATRHAYGPLSELLPAGERPDVDLERAEMRARIDAAIARLPEQRRTAFHLCDVEGYDTGEVARIMGLSSGTVRSHVHHARMALRAALADALERTRNAGE
jgi:RNA polymerase sigma-70 factor (ECF subfamily)